MAGPYVHAVVRTTSCSHPPLDASSSAAPSATTGFPTLHRTPSAVMARLTSPNLSTAFRASSPSSASPTSSSSPSSSRSSGCACGTSRGRCSAAIRRPFRPVAHDSSSAPRRARHGASSPRPTRRPSCCGRRTAARRSSQPSLDRSRTTTAAAAPGSPATGSRAPPCLEPSPPPPRSPSISRSRAANGSGECAPVPRHTRTRCCLRRSASAP
jgi:hypothetical protein